MGGAGAALAPSPGAGPDLSPTETSVPFTCGNRAPSPRCLVLNRAQYTCSFPSVRCFALFSYKKCNLCLWPPPRSQHTWPMGTVPARLWPRRISSQGLSPAEPTPPSHLAGACAPVTTPAPLQLIWLRWASPPPGSPPGCLSSAGPPFTVHTRITAVLPLSPLAGGWGCLLHGHVSCPSTASAQSRHFVSDTENFITAFSRCCRDKTLRDFQWPPAERITGTPQCEGPSCLPSVFAGSPGRDHSNSSLHHPAWTPRGHQGRILGSPASAHQSGGELAPAAEGRHRS